MEGVLVVHRLDVDVVVGLVVHRGHVRETREVGRRGRGGGGAQGRQAGVAQCAPRLVPSTEGEAGSPTARPYVVYTTYYLRITATYALRTAYSLGAVQDSATVLILYLYCTYTVLILY